MPIPVSILINLGILLGSFILIALIFSYSAARGFKFHSCKGENGQCCRDKSGPTTAEKILALIDK